MRTHWEPKTEPILLMDATSDRTTFPAEDSSILPCCLEQEEESRWSHFPKAELCVAGSAICGFLVISGLTMIVLHYTVESKEGFHSVMEHYRIDSFVLGLSLVVFAGLLVLCVLFAYALWKVMRVIEMAHRYEEHKEFCAYEDLRLSFRSQQSMVRCATVDVGRYSSTAGSKDTPRK